MKIKLLACFVALVIMRVSIKSSYALNPPSGTWTNQCFTVSGNSCTNPPYTPTAKDGGGFASNQSSNNNQDPIVRATNSVCIEISVSSGQTNPKVWWEPGSILPPQQISTTDQSGNMDVKFVVTIPTQSCSQCFTSPQKVIYFNNGTPSNSDFNRDIIYYIWTGSSDSVMPPNQGAPEFPIGILSMLIPSLAAVLLVRRSTFNAKIYEMLAV
jgi:hypothetical protein